ncbi:MAG TPA: hypothetical protein VFC73_06295 [Syntrophomonadaceae bacterium]|nr:hypothetical protein [Syntrophomonadaceae bacterium]
MLIIILVVVLLLILLIELPRLIKENFYREIGVFGVVFIVGSYMALAFFYNWPLFDPFEPLAIILSKS